MIQSTQPYSLGLLLLDCGCPAWWNTSWISWSLPGSSSGIARQFTGNKHIKIWPGWVAVARLSGLDVLHISAIVFVWTFLKSFGVVVIFTGIISCVFIDVFGVWASGNQRLPAIE
ncbi:hypothetical protein BDP55DRAFT_281908 [Colletotrichum godetiae]|uniref:Uncharacterized protein n=1 Tax=Colletotrichum godetiae TaxID=1209918 RepID=A0AAJ0ADN3_9PEZI|nr:uncharacterized protein BDP55DRAFT_281908 [Colletotrichum godetiae]KAK1671959.1 hypothetical protein BDP55DRAFT_281908 [Colletotrichum godetiae]